MSHLKSVFAALLLAAIVGVAPSAHAAPVLKVMMVGASGTWQALGVGTYKGGACPTNVAAGACLHYSNGSFTLTDTRPGQRSGNNANNIADTGAIWIVWDKAINDPNCNSCNVWAYIKVDTIVGNRCYFAKPRCTVSVASFPAPVAQITLPAPAWGSESTPPASIQSLFTTGIKVNVAVTEVRPEDAQFGQCRINSQVGGAHDGLDGLGLGSNATGTCPSFTAGTSLTGLSGTNLTSSYPGSGGTAHPLAFNISGNDPYTNTAIPAYSQVTLGVIPLVFITARQNKLAGVTNATLPQLQTLFSGANCSGDVLAGGTAGDIDVYLREPLSGTMNATEYTAFRLPLGADGNYGGASQETGLTGLAVKNVGCTSGTGKRRSSIGSGEEVKFVQHSNDTSGSDVIDQTDGIGYTFYSYGNVSNIKGNTNWGYLTVDGVDPIFSIPFSGVGTPYDDGQSTIPGALPSIADVAACSGAFPCHENKIWKGGLSFPNVRSGAYKQWAVVRLVADGSNFTNASALVASAQQSAITTVPDFIVPAAITIGSFTDPGMKLWRSHYTQKGVAPLNQQSGDKGGDEGGCIVSNTSVATKLVMRNAGCALGN